MTELKQRIEAAIKDAYYAARDNGGTMHTAATDATEAVLAVLAAPDEATIERLARAVAEYDGHDWDRAHPDEQDAYVEHVNVTLAALGAPEQTGHHGGQGEAVRL